MANLIKYVFGPKLFRLFKFGDSPGRDYVPNTIEKCGDQILRLMSICFSLGLYTSPIIAYTLYKKGYFNPDGFGSLARITASLGVIWLGSLCIRGLGRKANPEYTQFLAVLEAALSNLTKENKILLNRYDFEFKAFPVEFKLESDDSETTKKKPIYLDPPENSIIYYSFGYVLMHTVGRRMIYPGTLGVINSFMSGPLRQGRTKLVEEYGAERFKLLTREGNEIDTIFVDRRKSRIPSEFPNKHILVIVCEGNAGFYEVGMVNTPLDAGYSVLGWNHPGFGGSTGLPFPRQEANAIDTVIRFAIGKDFSAENIVVYAWSIGGYTATWAAMNYPDLRGVVLDATFDDLRPLAIAKMPIGLDSLITMAITDHMNLNNAEQLERYNGPVLLIRRTRDEMISTDESRSLETNRGNNLLIKLMEHRYPNLLNDSEGLGMLHRWLVLTPMLRVMDSTLNRDDDDVCQAKLNSFNEGDACWTYPSQIGNDMSSREKMQLTLFLAKKYMVDYESTHCTQLPASEFTLPWEPNREATNGDFIKVNKSDLTS